MLRRWNTKTLSLSPPGYPRYCTATTLPDGTTTDRFIPDARRLLGAKPVYATLPGWEEDSELRDALYKIEPLAVKHTEMTVGMQVLTYLGFSMLLMVVIWFVLRRSSDPFGGGGMMGSFIRSPARRFEKDDKAATFDDVAGLKSTKQDLEEVVQFLKTPDDFTRLGATIPCKIHSA